MQKSWEGYIEKPSFRDQQWMSEKCSKSLKFIGKENPLK
jgi:hypothetical protein